MNSIRRVGRNKDKKPIFSEDVKYVTGSGMGHSVVQGSDILKEYTEEERLQILPKQRESYNAGEITSFEQAKQAADETYMQYWYDTLNEIASEWTDQDYALVENPIYKRDSHRGRTVGKERIEPARFEEYQEALERIEQGPLDFSKKETHFELISDQNLVQGRRGKYQYWISEDDPLRQALEAQADVMTDYLDENNIPLFVEFPEGTRQEGMRGEGVYLNTGTAAHIDWEGRLVRMEQYHSSPDSELGSYSHVRYQPPSEGFGKPLTILGTLTGNPWIAAAGTIASGGDIEDVITNVATGAVLQNINMPPVVEEGFASLGIDADLLGMDALEFSDRMMDVQNDIVLGESGTDALVDNFGIAAVSAVADNIDIDIDLPESELLSDLGDAIEPIVNVVKAGADVVQEVTEPVIDVIDEGLDIFGSEVVDPTLQAIQETGEAIIDPIDDALDAFGEEVVDPALQAGSDVLSEVEDWAKEAGYIIDDLVDWEKLLELFLADKGGKTSTPIESLFKDEIYKSDLKESPDKIVSDEEIAKILNFNNTTNQKANPLLSGLFSKPKTIAEQQEENSNRRAEIRSNLLKSSKDKASGLFSI